MNKCKIYVVRNKQHLLLKIIFNKWKVKVKESSSTKQIAIIKDEF